jgi:hypothetical protein
MNKSVARLSLAFVLGLLALGGRPVRAADPAPTAAPAPLRDSHGNTLRRAPTGHITNYDEDRVAPYTLRDPLVLLVGRRVRDAVTWLQLRRPELLKLYETDIYGRVPERAPKVTWEVAGTEPVTLDGTAMRKEIIGHFGDKPDGPTLHVHLYLPVKAAGPVPVLLHLLFSGDPPAVSAGPARRFNETGPIADILAHGYGYATFRYTEVQPDAANTTQAGVIGLALAPGQTKPAADE